MLQRQSFFFFNNIQKQIPVAQCKIFIRKTLGFTGHSFYDMKHLFRISILFFLFYGCAEQQPEGTAVVSGNVSGAGGEILYLEELTPSDLIRVDSVKIGENGRFRLSCQPDETGIYLVKRVNGRFITVILDKGDHVEVIANDSDFSGRYRISGNETP